MAPVAKETISSSPSGQDYKVACIALDLTGRKLIDEICHIGAYCPPDKAFSQYVMPYRDISRSASITFGIKIFTSFGRYRALKDTKTLKTLKTKSEYSTLTDFMDWLKEVKGTSDGILLAFHDNKNQTVTPFLMGALERYKMTDDFFEIVKGFVCCQDVTDVNPEFQGKPVTIRALAKRLLQLEDNNSSRGVFHSAKDRAGIVYQLLQKILETEDDLNAADLMKYASTRSQEMENLKNQRRLAEKIRSLRPIFTSQIRRGSKDRNRAVILRRYLIDAKLDYEDLSQAFESGQKDTVTEIVSTKTQAKKKEKDMEELIDIIVAFFKNGGGAKRDMNGNVNVKKNGQGDGQPNGASTSSTETDDDEFEEAKEAPEVIAQ
ncbi:unnamed protein product [Orchesella dallaii]|uniref:Maternal protein exuperantia n=1 Tax=Orchesella dallaii TaxID=48710 RepID=A0ABP1PYH5_9HEXA